MHLTQFLSSFTFQTDNRKVVSDLQQQDLKLFHWLRLLEISTYRECHWTFPMNRNIHSSISHIHHSITSNDCFFKKYQLYYPERCVWNLNCNTESLHINEIYSDESNSSHVFHAHCQKDVSYLKTFFLNMTYSSNKKLVQIQVLTKEINWFPVDF